MKLSELIKILQDFQAYHGDTEVYVADPDYPGPVQDVHIQIANNNAYIPVGAVVIRTRT